MQEDILSACGWKGSLAPTLLVAKCLVNKQTAPPVPSGDVSAFRQEAWDPGGEGLPSFFGRK